MYAMVDDCNNTGYLYPNVIHQCENLLQCGVTLLTKHAFFQVLVPYLVYVYLDKWGTSKPKCIFTQHGTQYTPTRYWNLENKCTITTGPSLKTCQSGVIVHQKVFLPTCGVNISVCVDGSTIGKSERNQISNSKKCKCDSKNEISKRKRKENC